MSNSSGFHRRVQLCVFICGAALMILEISGSRLVAPFLGSSIYVWTSIIGVILAALSAGYYWGGIYADKKPSAEIFSSIIFAAAAITCLTGPAQYPVLHLINTASLDLRLAAVLASTVLFALPSFLLGMVTPFALRISVEEVSSSGQIAGRLYAFSTLGSIVGTFATGFVLISYLGSTSLIYLVSLLLLGCSLLVAGKDKLVFKLILLVFLYLLYSFNTSLSKSLEKAGMRDIDTTYHRALIIEKKEEPNNRLIRYLVTDPLGSQSSMFVDEPNKLSADYAKYYDLAFHFNPSGRSALLLGGGAYSYPKHFLSSYPDKNIDVVEIDPGLTRIAKEFFSLKEDPRLRIYHEDARTFLASTSNNYDVIYLDVFSSSPEVPFQLSTQETALLIHGRLNENGVLLMNMISAVEGEAGKFLRAEIKTYQSVFPNVFFFLVEHPGLGKPVQNIVMAALKSKKPPLLQSQNPELNLLLSRRWEDSLANDVPILRDNFAPVERYMLPALLALAKQTEKPKRSQDK